MAETRACLVDVYETLLAYDFSAHARELATRAGVGLTRWRQAQVSVEQQFDSGALSAAGAFTRILEAAGARPRPDLVAELVRADAEYMTAGCRPYDDAVPFLEQLAARGVKTALVSNCGANTRPLLADLNLIPLADEVILSCEVGCAKPSPEIYRTALDALGVAAAEAVMVDDQAPYCAGAAALGIRAIQIVREDPDGQPAESAFPVARSLHDAARML